MALLSDPDVLRASPKGGRALLGRSGRGACGGQEPQSQICRQDEQCMLGARNTGPGGVPSCWPGFGCPQAEGPRGGVWCEHSVSPPRTLGQRLFSLSPTPPRLAQVPTQSPQAGVGAFPAPAPACCHLTSTPAACLRNAHFSDVGAENEAQPPRLSFLLRQEVKGSSDHSFRDWMGAGDWVRKLSPSPSS